MYLSLGPITGPLPGGRITGPSPGGRITGPSPGGQSQAPPQGGLVIDPGHGMRYCIALWICLKHRNTCSSKHVDVNLLAEADDECVKLGEPSKSKQHWETEDED